MFIPPDHSDQCIKLSLHTIGTRGPLRLFLCNTIEAPHSELLGRQKFRSHMPSNGGVFISITVHRLCFDQACGWSPRK